MFMQTGFINSHNFSEKIHRVYRTIWDMSASRKKVKKQLKKQNRVIQEVTVPRLPKARRKGGQYIYPAGAYRSVMIAPPASLIPSEGYEQKEPALSLSETVIEPVSIPLPEIQPEEAIETVHNWRKLIPAFSACLLVFAFLIANASQPPARPVPLGTKVSLSAELTRQSLSITEAEPIRQLSVAVDPDEVKKAVQEYLDEQSGEYAVYIKNLDTDDTIVINDHQMPSASLIKLFVAGCYFEETEAGRLAVSDMSERELAMMISWSDNNAWQALETRLGGGNYSKGLEMVTAFAKAHGYKDTGRLIGGASIYSPDAENLTSVNDVGRLLEEVVKGEYVSEKASGELLELMKDQHITTKIPAGLPEGIGSANKTGELSGVENDAAIVYGQNMDYILVIMSDQNYIGTGPVAELSSLIYGLLNPLSE